MQQHPNAIQHTEVQIAVRLFDVRVSGLKLKKGVLISII